MLQHFLGLFMLPSNSLKQFGHKSRLFVHNPTKQTLRLCFTAVFQVTMSPVSHSRLIEVLARCQCTTLSSFQAGF
jgi:hypothetical protein